MDFRSLIDSATLEENLRAEFTPKMYEDLNLPITSRPNFSMPLPRYSIEGLPKNLFVKKEFSSIRVLKKRIIDKAILSLYAPFFTKDSQKIGIISYIIEGGIGDYTTQHFVKSLITNAFPNLEVYTVSIFCEKPPKHLTASPHQFIIESKQPSAQFFSQNLKEKIASSSLLLELPTKVPNFNTLLNSITSKYSQDVPVELLGENGFILSNDFHPETNSRCLGLHFLEFGVLTPNFDLSKITTPKYSNLPSHIREKIIGFGSFYFAYLNFEKYTKDSHKTYLELLLKLNQSDSHDINVVSPDILGFIRFIQCQVQSNDDENLLKIKRIRSVHIFLADNYSCIDVCKDGEKNLVLLQTGPLKHEDFLSLLKASKEPVAVRGCQSFIEAIYIKKIFFYDALKHNKTMLNEFAAYAKPYNLLLSDFFVKLHKSPTNELVEFLVDFYTDDLAQNGFEKLMEEVVLECSANNNLLNLIKKNLAHKHYPELKKRESHLVDDFLHSKTTFSELISQLRDEITRYIETQQSPS